MSATVRVVVEWEGTTIEITNTDACHRIATLGNDGGTTAREVVGMLDDACRRASDAVHSKSERGQMASMNDEEVRRIRAGLAGELDIAKKSIKPPYMFTDVVDQLFPTMDRITIGEALQDVWDSASSNAANAVNRYLDGLVQR